MTAHIYIVDDDKTFRDSLAGIVSSVGFTFDAWGDPEPLLSGSVQNFRRPGCIVLDYRIPALSGMEVLKTIKRVSAIPVILISAFADIRIAVAAMQVGAEGVFEKPLDDNEFLGFIEHLCFEDRGRIQRRNQCRAVQEKIAELSEAERRVLDLMLEGQPNKVMANTLGKSVKAVERNRQNVAAKLGCRTAHEVLLKVARCPMVTASPLACSRGPCKFSLSGRI